MRETVANFRGVEHRIEYVTEIDGVKFYNDSKATSVDATSKALEALSEGESKTILIIGGRGKNAPYAPLVELIERSVRTLVLKTPWQRVSKRHSRVILFFLHRRVRASTCSTVSSTGERFLRKLFWKCGTMKCGMRNAECGNSPAEARGDVMVGGKRRHSVVNWI
jgi:hypothetical protein